MPILRLKEVRSMSPEDRAKRLGDLRTEFVRLKTMVRAGGTVENPARMKDLRKAIAKLLTVNREEELGIRKAKKRKEKKTK